MGTPYVDAGQVRVVNVLPKVSVAQVIFSCGYMQRGDILQPYQDRPATPFKDSAAFDHFAPVTGSQWRWWWLEKTTDRSSVNSVRSM